MEKNVKLISPWSLLYIGLFIVALLSSTFIYLHKLKQIPVEDLPQTPTSIAVTEQPRPTAQQKKQVTVNKTTYDLVVLNGQGVTGTAAAAKIFLEKEGFKVTSVGDADNYNYQNTVIRSKKTVSKDFLDKLKNTLQKNYTVSKKVEEITNNEEVVIVIGENKPALK